MPCPIVSFRSPDLERSGIISRMALMIVDEKPRLGGITRTPSSRRRDDIDAAMEEGVMEIVPRLQKPHHYNAVFSAATTTAALLDTITALLPTFTAVAPSNPA